MIYNQQSFLLYLNYFFIKKIFKIIFKIYYKILIILVLRFEFIFSILIMYNIKFVIFIFVVNNKNIQIINKSRYIKSKIGKINIKN